MGKSEEQQHTEGKLSCNLVTDNLQYSVTTTPRNLINLINRTIMVTQKIQILSKLKIKDVKSMGE